MSLLISLRNSTPPQIRQRILHYHSYKEQVDGFVWELTFEEDFKNTLCEMNSGRADKGVSCED